MRISEKIGLIDFDDAKYGETIIDIAILIANLYFSKTKQTNIEGIKTFLNEYYKNDNELKKTEIVLIKSAAEKWIDYVLNRNILESSTTDSFKVKKEKLKNLILDNLFKENTSMKVITICGSLRFQKEMMMVAEKLALKGNCVLTPIYGVIENIEITKEQLMNLKEEHLKRIELSDSIYVINKDNYIGKSTKLEIEYAKKLGKEIIYFER